MIPTAAKALLIALLLSVLGSPVLAQGREFNVKSFGAVGDGMHDDTSAIQAALDAARDKGGVVYVPTTSAYYRTTDRLFVWNDETLRGDGPRSKIYRIDPEGPTRLKLGALVVGAYGGLGSPNSPLNRSHMGVHDIPAGSSTIAFDDPSDSARFHPGDLIFVWDPHQSAARLPEPVHAMVNEVATVSDGSLTTRYPFLDDYRSDGENSVQVGAEIVDRSSANPAYVARHTTVEDLTIAQSDRTRQYTIIACVFDSTFQNLTIDGSNLIGISGGFSTLKNIDGEYGVCPLEFGDFSNNFEVDNFIAKRVAEPRYPKTAYGFVAHGAGEDITFDSCEITDYRFPGSIGTAGFETTFPRTKFVNCIVHGSQGPGFAFRHKAVGSSARGCIVEQSYGKPFAVDADSVTLEGDRPEQ